MEKIVADAVHKFFLPDSAQLHGSGREDIDVRMLGRGRPFVLELINPKRAIKCHQRLEKIEAALQTKFVKVNSV